jgi:hypothetical protein
LTLSIIVPLASFVILAIFSVSLGYVFYQVHHHTSMGTLGVIAIGMLLLILTPLIAYILERKVKIQL